MKQKDDQQRHNKEATDWLPEQLSPGVSYTVPDEYKSDPGTLFAYVCAICFGSDFNDVMSFFGVSRQTFWIWRQPGKGVPENYKDRVIEALKGEYVGGTVGGKKLFRLPKNARIEDMMRKPRGQNNTQRIKEPQQNIHLLELINRIVNSPELGHAALKTLVGQMSRPVSNPHVFYRWAWAIGGVPRSYVTPFITALMQLRIYELYGYGEGNRVQWEGWAERHLLAPDNAEDYEET